MLSKMLKYLLSSQQIRFSNLNKNLMLNRIKFGLKLYSTATGETCKSRDVSNLKPSVWEPIYFFRPVKIASAVSNLKLIQLGLTTLGIPLCFTLENMTQVPAGATAIFSAIGISGTVTLFIFAKLASGLVGFLYTNQTLDRVKISYIDFWGKRRNIEAELNDIKPFSEIQTFKFNIYMPIQFYSNQNSLKLLHTFGEVYDFAKFDKIFYG